MSFFWRDEDAAREAQSFARIRVVRADLHARKLAERHFLRGIVEQHEVQRVAGILRADQMRQRERHFLGRREAILAVKNHAVAAIEHEHGGAGTLVFGLMNHQVRIIEFDRNFRAFAAHGVEQCPADIEIQRVAEFVGARDAARFDAGRQIARVMPPEAALSERPHQILERLESQKVDRLVRDFKARIVFPVAPLADLPARSFIRRRRHLRIARDVSLLHQPVDQLVDQLFHLGVHLLGSPVQQIFQLLIRKQVAFFERSLNCLTQGFHRLFRVHFREPVKLRFVTALQEKIGQALDEFLQIDAVGRLARVFRVADKFRHKL